ncbi:hypothetical protein ACOME3_005286 [Neoechinorhynchus agilis]
MEEMFSSSFPYKFLDKLKDPSSWDTQRYCGTTYEFEPFMPSILIPKTDREISVKSSDKSFIGNKFSFKYVSEGRESYRISLQDGRGLISCIRCKQNYLPYLPDVVVHENSVFVIGGYCFPTECSKVVVEVDTYKRSFCYHEIHGEDQVDKFHRVAPCVVVFEGLAYVFGGVLKNAESAFTDKIASIDLSKIELNWHEYSVEKGCKREKLDGLFKNDSVSFIRFQRTLFLHCHRKCLIGKYCLMLSEKAEEHSQFLILADLVTHLIKYIKVEKVIGRIRSNVLFSTMRLTNSGLILLKIVSKSGEDECQGSVRIVPLSPFVFLNLQRALAIKIWRKYLTTSYGDPYHSIEHSTEDGFFLNMQKAGMSKKSRVILKDLLSE